MKYLGHPLTILVGIMLTLIVCNLRQDDTARPIICRTPVLPVPIESAPAESRPAIVDWRQRGVQIAKKNTDANHALYELMTERVRLYDGCGDYAGWTDQRRRAAVRELYEGYEQEWRRK